MCTNKLKIHEPKRICEKFVRKGNNVKLSFTSENQLTGCTKG